VAAEGDLDACNRLRLRIHGHERGRELLDAIRQRTATVVENGGRITGYATLLGFLGHAVGESNEHLKALIAAAPSFVVMSLGLYNDPSGAFLPSILY
jgi:hypothetical protein